MSKNLVSARPELDKFPPLAALSGSTVAAASCRTSAAAQANPGAVADAIFAAFARIDAVKVTVHKPHAPIAAIFEDVGVVLTRKRQSP